MDKATQNVEIEVVLCDFRVGHCGRFSCPTELQFWFINVTCGAVVLSAV